MAAALQYLLNTLKVVALEKVSFSNTQNPKMTEDDKHYLLNRDNLTEPIQMQLYEKQKNFSEFFSCIFKIYIKFKTFAKKG